MSCLLITKQFIWGNCRKIGNFAKRTIRHTARPVEASKSKQNQPRRIVRGRCRRCSPRQWQMLCAMGPDDLGGFPAIGEINASALDTGWMWAVGQGFTGIVVPQDLPKHRPRLDHFLMGSDLCEISYLSRHACLDAKCYQLRLRVCILSDGLAEYGASRRKRRFSDELNRTHCAFS